MPNLVEDFDQNFGAFIKTPAGVPFADMFEPITTEQFKEQAGNEVNPFFDENLSNAMKNIELAKEQQKESKQLAERQTEESFTAFQGIADRNFARVLGSASGRFAGKGTATSGFRQEALGNFFQGKEDVLSEAERAKRQAGETRDLGFEQFIEGKNAEERDAKLRIERDRREERSARQRQLQGDAITASEQVQGTFDKAFSSFLGQVGGA